MNDNIIQINDLVKSYKNGSQETKVLKGINLTIKRGQINTILGASGAGKTTLLNIMSCLEQPNSGSVKINDIEVTKLTNKQLVAFRRENLGFIFQAYNLIDTLNVEKNIQMSSYLSKNPLDIDELLDDLEILDKKHKYIYQLSGGEQQRVAIARALIKNSQILFCDEPTGALDEKTSKKILSVIKKLSNKHNITVVMITHNNAIAQMSHKTIIINSGKIVDQILRNDDQLVEPENLKWD